MGRLFAGTPWDRPPTCSRCGKLEPECGCPAEPGPEPARLPPETQTARLRTEKRPRGKQVTTIRGLESEGNDLEALAARLKSACGTGGTVKDGSIELQGDHLRSAEAVLKGLGYRTRVG